METLATIPVPAQTLQKPFTIGNASFKKASLMVIS